jgi:hypothetical protein
MLAGSEPADKYPAGVTPTKKDLPAISITFGTKEWQHEVERYEPNSPARIKAEGARKEIEGGRVKRGWMKCRSEGSADGTTLPGCVKIYVPLAKHSASEAPYGFVFELEMRSDGTLGLDFLAFGERHPRNERSRSVYERAHRRLHGRYPS